MKILITGFSSFPGVEKNPTELLLNSWSKSTGVEVAVLPVSYRFCKQWSESRSDYDIIIHLGVAVERETNCLEMNAFNKVGNFQDTEGYIFTELVGEISKYECQLDLTRLKENLNNTDFKVSISESAGDYLCNFIYYLTLERNYNHNFSGLFVHIPPFDIISKKQQLCFLDRLVEETILQHQNRSH